MLVIPPSINRTANSPPPPNSAFLSLSTSSLLLVVLPVGRWCCSSSYYSSSSSPIFAQPLPHAHAHAHTHPPTSGSRSPPSRSPCRLPAVAATLHLEFPRLLFFLARLSVLSFDLIFFFPLLLPSHSGSLFASASIWLLLPWLPLLTDNHPPRFVYPP